MDGPRARAMSGWGWEHLLLLLIEAAIIIVAQLEKLVHRAQSVPHLGEPLKMVDTAAL